MSYKFLLKTVFVWLLVITPALSFQSIVIYRDFGHKGDEGQVKGILHALNKHTKDIPVKEFNIDKANELKAYVESLVNTQHQQPLVIAVGEKTVDAFSKVLPLPGALTVHVCHMATKSHPELLGKVNFIILPKHATESIKKNLKDEKTKLIETVGVAHNRRIEEIEQVYQENKDKIPQASSLIGIILPGDAPTPDGKMLLFTEADARLLARQLVQYWASLGKKHYILIANGPRTGKHDPSTVQEIKEVHRNGKMDAATAAFIDELKKNGLKKSQFTLFDFQFDSSSPNDMAFLLGAIRSYHATLFVPGESTSLISETIDVLPAGRVIVYNNAAMNTVHQAHVQSEFEAGRVRLAENGFQEIKESNNKDDVVSSSAADTIATGLLRP